MIHSLHTIESLNARVSFMHAGILLYEGVSISYVSSRIGHGEVETTFNNYIHVIKELEERDQMKTADIFEKMLR